MNQSENVNYEDILAAVQQWPAPQQIALVQDVLKTLELARPRQATLSRALGLLATNQPAPTDEEVKQWLDEHRMEKYG